MDLEFSPPGSGSDLDNFHLIKSISNLHEKKLFIMINILYSYVGKIFSNQKMLAEVLAGIF